MSEPKPEPMRPATSIASRQAIASADPRFFARIGMAIVNPRWALAVAGDRRAAGRSGSDLIRMIVVLLLATQLRGLVASIWLVEESGSLAMRGVMHVLTRSLTLDLGFLVVGAMLVWLLAGPKRNLGRAFDLACVAALPLLFVDIGATFVVRALDARVPIALMIALSVLSWAWTGALLALAIGPARVATPRTASPPIGIVRLARRAGLGVIAVAVTSLAIQLVWIARNVEQVRPVVQGEEAPAFSLPRITDAKGTPGAQRTLAESTGKIVVVDFWATWCNPCLKSLPKLEALAKQPGVDVIAINLVKQDDAGEAFGLFAQRGYSMTLLADDGMVSDRYGVTTIPHTVVIDREGRVRHVARGPADIAAIVEQIRK